jgi:hypothetical protein
MMTDAQIQLLYDAVDHLLDEVRWAKPHNECAACAGARIIHAATTYTKETGFVQASESASGETTLGMRALHEHRAEAGAQAPPSP